MTDLKKVKSPSFTLAICLTMYFIFVNNGAQHESGRLTKAKENKKTQSYFKHFFDIRADNAVKNIQIGRDMLSLTKQKRKFDSKTQSLHSNSLRVRV
jgi:hypothetical protein